MGVVGAVGAAGAVGAEWTMELRLGLGLVLGRAEGRETEAIRALAASGGLQLAVGGHPDHRDLCAPDLPDRCSSNRRRRRGRWLDTMQSAK